MKSTGLIVLVFAASLLLPSKIQAQPLLSPTEEEVFRVISEEPCLRPIVETHNYDWAMLAFYLHRYHRFQYPLRYLCTNGKPLDEETLSRLLDRWSRIITYERHSSPPPTLGIRFEMRNHTPFILQVGQYGPAFHAGLQRGDFLERVNNRRLKTINQALDVLSVPEGKTVSITFLRNGQRHQSKLSARPFEVPPHQIIRFGSYLYLEIARFARNTDDILSDLRRAYLEFPLNGLILDLRDCPGGLINDAGVMSGWFLGQKTNYLRSTPATGTFLEEVPTYPRDDYFLEKVLQKIPLIVLVNSHTYSAAEMVAGALKHYKRGLLVGEPTGGKGTIGAPFSWTKNRDLMLNISLWHIPDGSSIEKRGLEPDITTEEKPETCEAFRTSCENGCDLLEQPSIQTALDLLDYMSEK